MLGLSRAELKERLLEDYREQLRNQDVQITLLQSVRVLGAVNEPGLYHIDGTMTLGDVVALAGGVNDEGTLQNIRIQRFDGTEDALVDVRIEAPLAEQIQSGDQILVPRRSWLSRYGTFVVGTALSIGFLIVATNRYYR